MNLEALKTEYRDAMKFITMFQEQHRVQQDQVLSKMKELEYKKKQIEYVIAEREKNKNPNYTMFSPLDTEDTYEQDVAEKDALDEITQKLSEVTSEWEQQKCMLQAFEKLKKFCSSIEKLADTDELDNALMNYSTKILATQEMDRNRIARDLHDSTVQGLTTLVHKTEYCSKLLDKDPVRVKLELQSMIELNKDIINGMREIIYDLRPMSLNNLGLVSTIESYCLYLRRNGHTDIVLQVKGQERELTSIMSITLFRIIQEACNNALRHACAKKITVKLTYTDDTIVLDIDDNGNGFEVSQVEERNEDDELHGFGLSIMKERARLLNGTFSLKTKPGKGTKIHVVVPVKYTTNGNGEKNERAD